MIPSSKIKNELTRKETLGSLSPDEEELLTRIRDTGKWTDDEEFRAIYLQEEPTTDEEWVSLMQRTNLEPVKDQDENYFLNPGGTLAAMTSAVEGGHMEGQLIKTDTGSPGILTDDGVFVFNGLDGYYSPNDSEEIIPLQ